VKKTAFIASHVGAGDLKHVTKPSGEVIKYYGKEKEKPEPKKEDKK
jgi:hypothetical protein